MQANHSTHHPDEARSTTRALAIAAAVALVTVSVGTIAIGPGDHPHAHDHAHGLTTDAIDVSREASVSMLTGDVQAVPTAADGFAVQPLAPATVPTAITFGQGEDLFAATAGGQIVHYDLAWTPAGPVVQDTSIFASGFTLPQGLAFDDEGNLYVSDVRQNETTSTDPNAAGRPLGRVTKLDPFGGNPQIVVDGLPNGQHNTNHLRFGPDGLLYMPNGNANDHGNGTGSGQTDIFPYSGAFLAADVNGVDPDLPDTTPGDAAVLHWRDEQGQAIPDDQIVDHARNQDFASKIDVFAHGFRNVFGIAFAPQDLPFAGAAYTGMNGADDPSSQDSVYKIQEDTHHGYPFCYNVGQPGATGDAVTKIQAPDTPNPDFPCQERPAAGALLGWHVCATGVGFPTDAGATPVDASFPEPMHRSLFVGECGPFGLQDSLAKTSSNPTTHNTGHKVARVALDENGEPTGVEDFLTGLEAPTDVVFGPDGAMYVADADVLLRVFPTGDAPDANPTVPVAAVGQSFVPHVLVVPEGTTVEWVGDVLPHTVTTSDELCKPGVDPQACSSNDDGYGGGDPNTFDYALGSAPANTVQHTFTEAGVYPYFCENHYPIGMVGLVAVVDPTNPGAIDPGSVLGAVEGDRPAP